MFYVMDDHPAHKMSDMPTQFFSPIYKDHAPQLDAASIITLRKAGALFLGVYHNFLHSIGNSVLTEFKAKLLLQSLRQPPMGHLPAILTM